MIYQALRRKGAKKNRTRRITRTLDIHNLASLRLRASYFFLLRLLDRNRRQRVPLSNLVDDILTLQHLPEDRVFANELDQWEEDRSINVLVTVDNATGDWHGPVGVVTNLLKRLRVDAEKTIVLVCGPEILNRVAAWHFLQLHVPREQVYISLERNMNCGFGRCGHCQYGPYFVCKDGPVFSFEEVASIFAKEEI